MASLVVTGIGDFDIAAFHAHLAAHLPEYARPLFLRFQDHLEITTTFKTRKVDLVADGFDPARIRDPLYFFDSRFQAFVPLDAELYREICNGAVRV